MRHHDGTHSAVASQHLLAIGPWPGQIAPDLIKRHVQPPQPPYQLGLATYGTATEGSPAHT